ncbi:MAG: sigma 54-interacting transcriptional regulator [Myxococcota bacterium]|nr:sigma 54-interacting transcriptional regulator [Myxococcota bacterium]
MPQSNVARGSTAAAAPFAEKALLELSPAMQPTLDLVRRAQETRATVLLTGETGTGKEVLARAIHAGSHQRNGDFVAVNCASFPDTLLESELFGHIRGSFTGAHRDRRGLFEIAGRGTLFLDEIAETSRLFQAKLLRVLQEEEVRPLGADRPRPIQARVIAATNRSLHDEAERGHFRRDLYYRLAVFPIPIPPLRARPEDVLALASHFLEKYARRDGKTGCFLPPETRAQLQSYPWPGNVRELENQVQRAVALADPGTALAPDFFFPQIGTPACSSPESSSGAGNLRAECDRFEATFIRRALEQHGGRKSETARALGVTREGLYKKMKRLGVR